MALLTMEVPHDLSQEEALSRIKKLLANLKQEQKDMITNMTEEWEGNTGTFAFSIQGFDLSGTMEVLPASINIVAKLPFAVSLFKGKIREVIEQKAKELLSK